MKDFTSKAIIVYTKEIQENQDIITGVTKTTISLPDESLYFIPTFWEILQDGSPTPIEIPYLAQQAIKELLISPPFHTFLLRYLFMCIENIKAHKSVAQSYSISYYIMDTFSKNIETSHKSLTQWIEEISREYPLIDIILNSCIHYMEVVLKSQELKNPKADITMTTFEGNYCHSVNIFNRLRLLETVVKNGGDNVKMGKEKILKLWNLYVTDCKIACDTNQFLAWLCQENQQPNNILPSNFFQTEENFYLFDLIFQSRNQLTEKFIMLYFKCFAKQFKLVNLEKGAITIKYGRIRVLKFENLFGMDQLWDNAIFCADNARVKFCNLLIDVHVNLYEANYDKKIEICQAFLSKCMKNIINADPEKDQAQITNLIKLLVLFLEVIDGKKFSSYNEHSTSHTNPSTILITLKPCIDIIILSFLANTTKKLQVAFDVTIGKIRKMIADIFHLSFLGFQMSSSLRVYELEEDDYQLRELGGAQQIFAQIYTGYNSENLQSWIAHKGSFTNRLFLLLSKENTGYVDIVWDLLSSLPADQNILNGIQNLNVTCDTEVRHTPYK